MDLVIVGYITAVVIPIVGLIIGIVLAARPDRRVSRHGVRIVVASITVGIIAAVVITASIHNAVEHARKQVTQSEETANRLTNEAHEEVETDKRQAEERSARKLREHELKAFKAAHITEAEGRAAVEQATQLYKKEEEAKEAAAHCPSGETPEVQPGGSVRCEVGSG